MKSVNILFLSVTLLSSVFIGTSCSSLKPYQPTQYQGTQINQEKIDQLEVGFTKSQVIYLIGQPSLTNTLTPNIWQYIYTKKSQEKLNIEQNLILTFDESGLIVSIVD
ncbi:MAG: outer membrane protein assembly factor BamE [Saccharospirillaceae bacterium]|nr:outer membrane protein assembly factor BamE [Pseudomonadales bacterium]NRB80543.1 outer membrane protein assembly factor BamE [Saccharospirillaceae bacterium]